MAMSSFLNVADRVVQICNLLNSLNLSGVNKTLPNFGR